MVTAGPTWEFLDPLRYLTNRSTGMMGYEVASVARQRGHRVTLLSGPSSLRPPRGVRLLRVTTAREMRTATFRALAQADALVMAAAVADYRPARVHPAKLKRAHHTATLPLVANPDILAEVGRRFGGRKVLVGFALESADVLTQARRKLRTKRVDCIIGNTVRPGHVTFGAQPLADVVLLDRQGVQCRRRRASKRWVAQQILQFIEQRAAG